jgi:heptosyltransferase III
VAQAEIPRTRLFAATISRPRPYAVLHPFASEEAKTWPRENFLAVAAHLKNDLGLEPIFLGGPDEDLSAFGDYTCFEGAPLEEVKSLMAGAALFVGNDSGPAHIAAAFGRPVVVLFGPSDAGNWHPWRTENAVLASANGIHSIQVSEVTGAVDTLAPLPSAQQPA